MADTEGAALRVFGAPRLYVQGPGALDHVGDYVGGHTVAAVFVDELLAESLTPRLLAGLAAAGVQGCVTPIGGEVTQARIADLARQTRLLRVTVVVAVGGGKTLDTGKGVARELGLRMVTLPTIASNDGPTSRVIALYDDDHRLVDTPRMNDNPEAVIVDTDLVSRAPRRFLVSGIGDAIAKKFETAACLRGTGLTSNGSRPLALPQVIADGCYQILMRDGPAALASVDRQEASPELERVVEAVILMSGLAFENGGLSLAHALTRGLMVLPGASTHLHGYHVAYGLLVQLRHEGGDGAYDEVRHVLALVGLPLSLRDLDAVASPRAVKALSRAVISAPHVANCVPAPTFASLAAAIQAVEADGPPGLALSKGDEGGR